MKPQESLEIRKEMVLMHNEYLDRLESALEKENYIEASWLCYAIFEQRINRLIQKYIIKCSKQERNNNSTAAISTKIKCLKKAVENKYAGFDVYDLDLLDNILTWCRVRNSLVHDLVSLNKYKSFDAEFKKLAIEAKPLVKKIYEENTKHRQWYMEAETIEHMSFKGCENGYKCMKL